MATKKLNNAKYSISNVLVNKKEVSFDVMVSGNGITSYDIKATYSDGGIIYFAQDSIELDKNSVPHGNNSIKKGSNIFYNVNDEGVREVVRRTWPQS